MTLQKCFVRLATDSANLLQNEKNDLHLDPHATKTPRDDTSRRGFGIDILYPVRRNHVEEQHEQNSIDKPESFLSLARFIKDAAASLFFTEHET